MRESLFTLEKAALHRIKGFVWGYPGRLWNGLRILKLAHMCLRKADLDIFIDKGDKRRDNHFWANWSFVSFMVINSATFDCHTTLRHPAALLIPDYATTMHTLSGNATKVQDDLSDRSNTIALALHSPQQLPRNAIKGSTKRTASVFVNQ